MKSWLNMQARFMSTALKQRDTHRLTFTARVAGVGVRIAYTGGDLSTVLLKDVRIEDDSPSTDYLR